jgi:hypothetical protein
MFTGSLNINGQFYDAGLRAHGRLSIKGTSAKDMAEGAEAVAPTPQPEDSGQAQGGGVKENFEKSLLANLQKNKNTEDGLASAQEFAASISTAVDELKKQFGNEAANQAMAEILRATSGDNINPDKIAGAFTNVLQGLAQKNTAALANENLGDSEFGAVLKSQKNLNEFRKFLNDGTAANSAAPSLNTALNDYFPSANAKSFNEDFTWGGQAPVMDEQGGVNGSGYYGPEITIDDIGRENLAGFISFLRTELDSESEAQYFESLAGSADFLVEIEQLSDRFYFSDPEVELPPEGWAKDITIMGRIGPGREKAEKLGNYADHELTDLINKTIKDDMNVRNRVAKGLSPSLAAQEWEFAGWSLTGSRSAMLMENHAGGQPDWNFKNFEGSRTERRDNGLTAERFATEEMKKQGIWKDEYEGDWLQQHLFLQTLFDQGKYDGVGVNGLAFESKDVREQKFFNLLNSGQFTPEEKQRAYQDFQKTNSGQMFMTTV